MILQRLRGIAGVTITAAIPWTLIGLVTGVVLQLDLIPNLHAGLGSPMLGGLVTACTLAGALVGIVNGLTFSGLLLAAERGRTIDDLRGWRVAMWGAVATAGTLGFFFESPRAAILGGVVGAVGGIVALLAARRARAGVERTSSLSASDQLDNTIL